MIKPPYPPMEAKRADAIPTGDHWQFEPKWDGFRAVIFRDGGDVYVQSKAGQPLARYFPEIVEGIRSIRTKQFVLDGELVIPVEGHLSFDDLLLRIHPAESRVKKLAAAHPAHYFAFDLLHWKRDLTKRPIEERRDKLGGFFATPCKGLPDLAPVTTEPQSAPHVFRHLSTSRTRRI